MFVELNTLCGISPNVPPSGKCLTVEGNSLDSSFIAHHFVSMYMKTDCAICFLGLSQSFTHYNSVGNKLSLTLTKARDAGKLIFIEGVKLLGEQIVKESCPNRSKDSSSNETSVDYDDDTHSSLRSLFELCKSQVNKLQSQIPNKPFLFVIDDLSILNLLGIKPLDIIYFLSALRNLIVQSGNGCFLTRICAGKITDDEEMELIRQHLRHHSEYRLSVDNLPTGYSKEVHGQISVTTRSSVLDQGKSSMNTKTMQFKILDKSINFFAVGMSSAVL